MEMYFFQTISQLLKYKRKLGGWQGSGFNKWLEFHEEVLLITGLPHQGHKEPLFCSVFNFHQFYCSQNLNKGYINQPVSKIP